MNGKSYEIQWPYRNKSLQWLYFVKSFGYDNMTRALDFVLPEWFSLQRDRNIFSAAGLTLSSTWAAHPHDSAQNNIHPNSSDHGSESPCIPAAQCKTWLMIIHCTEDLNTVVSTGDVEIEGPEISFLWENLTDWVIYCLQRAVLMNNNTYSQLISMLLSLEMSVCKLSLHDEVEALVRAAVAISAPIYQKQRGTQCRSLSLPLERKRKIGISS